MPRELGVNEAPIPYDGRNLLGYRRYLERVAHAKIVAQIALETGGNVAEERFKRQHSPADARTLRGLPAVGRGVGGAMAGTRPDIEVVRRDEQRRHGRG